MNYSVLRTARYVSTLSVANYSFCCGSRSLFRAGSCSVQTIDAGKSQRHLSLQSSIESCIKTQTGIFRVLSQSTPVEYLQNFVVGVHDTTGLPWWATIICTTVLLRTAVTVPLAVYQHYIMGKVRNIHLELAEIAKELRIETAVAMKMYKWDEKTAKHMFNRSLKKQWNMLVVRDNCHPVKASLLIWFQIPMWISFSVALRNLVYMLPAMDASAHATYAELTVGGFGWISNLTQADPVILPITLGLINLAIVEIQSLSKSTEPTKFQRYVLNFCRGFSIFMVPVTACVPSCLALYWTTSSLCGLIQNLVLLSPRVKRFCRIPQSTLELEKPYSHIFSRFKHKVNSLIGVPKVS